MSDTQRRGFFPVPRGTLDHPALAGEPMCRRAAFVWMIEQARWAPGSANIAGKTVELDKGQFTASIRYMQRVFGWDSEARVRRFLSRLKADALIDAATDAGQLVITICDPDKNGAVVTVSDAPSDAPATQEPTQQPTRRRRTSDAGTDAASGAPTSGTNHCKSDLFDGGEFEGDAPTDAPPDGREGVNPTHQPTHQPTQESKTSKKTIQRKKTKEKEQTQHARRARDEIDGDFDEWWPQFPALHRHEGNRPQIAKLYRQIVKSGKASPADLLAATLRYAATKKVLDGYPCAPGKWLREERWLSIDGPPPHRTPERRQDVVDAGRDLYLKALEREKALDRERNGGLS